MCCSLSKEGKSVPNYFTGTDGQALAEDWPSPYSSSKTCPHKTAPRSRAFHGTDPKCSRIWFSPPPQSWAADPRKQSDKSLSKQTQPLRKGVCSHIYNGNYITQPGVHNPQVIFTIFWKPRRCKKKKKPPKCWVPLNCTIYYRIFYLKYQDFSSWDKSLLLFSVTIYN